MGASVDAGRHRRSARVCAWASRARAWAQLLFAILTLHTAVAAATGVPSEPPHTLDHSLIQPSASETTPCCVFQPLCLTEKSFEQYELRRYGNHGLAADEWFAGHTDGRGRRHGWGMVFTNRSDAASTLTGWWQSDELVRAGPVPFQSLCCHLSFRDLLERSQGLELKRTLLPNGTLAAEQWTYAPSWNDASVRLIARSPRATIMLYRGDVKEEAAAAADGSSGTAAKLMLPHGLGNWSTTTGTVLSAGRFVEGRLEGEGKMIFADHSTLRANHFRGGSPDGFGRGRWTWVHGRNRSYDGDLYGALPHGAGKLTLTGGGHYIGAWRYGQRHGSWGFEFFRESTPVATGPGLALVPPLTSIYGGAWAKGQRSGFGVERFQDGSEYCGTWLRGRQHGTGRLTTSDGTIMDGQWKHGRRVGFGVQLSAAGLVQRSGLWTASAYELVLSRPVPVSNLSIGLAHSLPPAALLIQPSTHSDDSFMWYAGELNTARTLPHGQGSWFYGNVDGAGDANVWEDTRCPLEWPAGSESVQWSIGRYTDGILQRGSRRYPNGDVYCGSMLNAEPDGDGLLLLAASGRTLQGHFTAGRLSLKSDAQWDSSSATVFVAANRTDHRRPLPRRRYPLMSQTKADGWMVSRNGDEVIEKKTPVARHPLGLQVTWNRTSGWLVDSRLLRGEFNDTELEPSVFGGMELTITFNHTFKLTGTLVGSEPSIQAEWTEPIATQRSFEPVPMSLLYFVDFLSARARTAQLIKASPAHSRSQYSHYYGQLNAESTLPFGQGAWFNSTDEVQEAGCYDEAGVLSGQGRRVSVSDDESSGMFLNGSLHGFGRIRFANGDVYVGTFEHGRRSNRPIGVRHANVWTTHGGQSCIGDWHNDTLHGVNSCTNSDGSEWTGEMHGGKKHGLGVQWNSRGEITRLGRWTRGRFTSGADDPLCAIPTAYLAHSVQFRAGTRAIALVRSQLFARSAQPSPAAVGGFRVYDGSTLELGDGAALPHGFGVWTDSDGSWSERGLFVHGPLLLGERRTAAGPLQGGFVGGQFLPWPLVVLLFVTLLACGLQLLACSLRLLRLADSKLRVSVRVRQLWLEHVLRQPLPLIDFLRSEGAVVDVSRHHLLYRVLRAGEALQVASHGLRALDPDASLSPMEHVRDGSKPGNRGSQFISASSDLSVSRLWAGAFRSIAVVRRRGVPTEVDLSSKAAQEQHLKEPHGAVQLRERTHAHRSTEVLLSRAVGPDDVAVCQTEVKAEMMWPTDAALNQWTRTATSNSLRSYGDERRALFPLPGEVSTDNFRVLGDKGRFTLVQHIPSERHYLSFCGAPNLHWSASFRQDLATPRQLIVQCQAEVTAMLLARILMSESGPAEAAEEKQHAAAAFAPAPAGDRASTSLQLPPCALYLCEVRHHVSRAHVAADGSQSSVFPLPEEPFTPLLLYPFDPINQQLCPFGASGPDPDPAAALQSVRALLLVDVLLGNVAPTSDVFVERREEAGRGHVYRRFGWQFALANRPDAALHLRPLYSSDATDAADTHPNVFATLQHLLTMDKFSYEPGLSARAVIPQLQSLLGRLDASSTDVAQLARAYDQCRTAEPNKQKAQIQAELDQASRERRSPPAVADAAAAPSLIHARIRQLRQLLWAAQLQPNYLLGDLDFLAFVRNLKEQPPAYALN